MPKPVLQSLILADHVYEDKLTGKRIIAGIFNRIIRGVRVVRQVGPPLPPPPLPPTTQPAAPQYLPPPHQPAAPAPAHSPEDYSAPPQYASPSMPAAPQPPAPAAPVNYPPAAPSYPSAQPAPTAPSDQPPAAPAPAPYRHPEVPAPEHNPAAHTPPAHQSLPPIQPGQLQPGQRVLEIPPTGLQSGSPFAYLSLTELRGAMAFVLQLVNLEDDSQLFRSDLRVECHNPLLTVEVTVPLPPISPPQAGVYALELLWSNEILGSLRIIVEDAVQQ